MYMFVYFDDICIIILLQRGILFYNKNDTCYYDGEWQNDEKHGYGKLVYESGNYYVGEWMHNKKHGQGKMVWKNENTIYIGEWNNDKQHGIGIYYIGTQKYDIIKHNDDNYVCNSNSENNNNIDVVQLREGDYQFKITDSILYCINWYYGMFENGYRHGFGTYFYASGARYDGIWKKNLKHGKMQYIHENGNKYNGEFVNDTCSQLEQYRSCDLLLFYINIHENDNDNNNENKNDNEGDTQTQRQIINNIILRNISSLKTLYNTFVSKSPNNEYLMTLKQIWSLLNCYRDKLLSIENNLCQLSQLVFNSYLINHSQLQNESSFQKQLLTLDITNPDQPVPMTWFVNGLFQISQKCCGYNSNDSNSNSNSNSNCTYTPSKKFDIIISDMIVPFTNMVMANSIPTFWDRLNSRYTDLFNKNSRKLFDEKINLVGKYIIDSNLLQKNQVTETTYQKYLTSDSILQLLTVCTCY